MALYLVTMVLVALVLRLKPFLLNIPDMIWILCVEQTRWIQTPLHRFGDEQIKSENGGKVLRTLKQYVDAIRQIAEYYSFPVLDLYATYGIQPKVDIHREKFVPDGLHPNDEGHKILAKKIVAFLRSM